MAKKKQTEELASDISDIDNAINLISKDYGEVVKTAQSIIDRPRQIIPISPALDSITGGIPEGSWVTLAGPSGFGKTVTALTIASTCQLPEYGSRPIFFYAAEGRLKQRDLKGIKGLDTSASKFHVIESIKGQILSSQAILDIATKFIEQIPNSVHIIDSVSSLVNPDVLAKGLGTQDRGAGYKIISQFCDLNQSVVPINNTIIIGIVHIIANTSGFGAPTKEKAANRWIYQSDVWLSGKYFEPWKVGAAEDSEQIGQVLHWQTKKTALYIGPGGKATSYLRYGTGVDKTYELIVTAKDLGLIEASASWLNLAFLPEPQKIQGMEKTYALIDSNPEMRMALEKSINTMLSGGTENESLGT